MKPRFLLRYAIAIMASATAIGLISMLNPIVGFLPLLLLTAILIVERFAGLKPAILAIVICTLVSLRFIDTHPYPDQRAHKLSEVIILPIVAGTLVYLLETRRKQKRVVHEQWLELSILLNSMTEGVYVFDSQGFVIEVNRSGAELSGRNRDGLLGTHYTEMANLLKVQRDELPLPMGEMGVARALRGEIVINENRSYIKPLSGEQVHAVVSATPMRVGKQQRVIGALLVIHDVTELAHLQQRIADTERHMAIGQMASGLAHDFNNVLNTITQATALMQLNSEQSPEERKRYLTMIDRAARTGAEIIKRVRDYVRGSAGVPSAVDLPLLMKEVIELAEPLLRTHRHITVETKFDQVSPIWINAADLRRMLTNLVINALQAMPNGGRLTLESYERDGVVYAKVSDTGEGIQPENQKKIFLPYFTTKAAGTGLGLSMAQKMLLTHGGNIDFVTQLGQGTTFTLQLPAMHSHIAKVA